MGSWPVIVPISPGVLCAAGDATTRMRAEVGRSFSLRRSATSNREVHAALSEMAQQANAALTGDGVPANEVTLTFEIDTRYFGQGFVVPMPVAIDDFKGDGIAKLGAAFDAEHRRLFTFNMETEHELVNLRCVAQGRELELEVHEIEKGDGNPAKAKISDHRMWVDGDWRDGAVYERTLLKAGDKIKGPAIVVEMDSTALILPGCVAEVDRLGNILINPA
jgi:N-methylhydantoinase A